MFKNKDGSYNKIQILIISLIALIGIGILISSVIPTSDTQSQNLDPLFIIVGILAFVIAGFIGFRILTKRKHVYKSPYDVDPPTKNDLISLQSKEPVTDIRAVTNGDYIEEPKPIKRIEQTSSSIGFPFISATVALVIGGVTLLIASSVVNTMMSAMPQVQENSEWSSTLATTTNNVTQAFSIMGLMIPLLAVGFIIVTMLKMTRI